MSNPLAAIRFGLREGAKLADWTDFKPLADENVRITGGIGGGALGAVAGGLVGATSGALSPSPGKGRVSSALKRALQGAGVGLVAGGATGYVSGGGLTKALEVLQEKDRGSGVNYSAFKTLPLRMFLQGATGEDPDLDIRKGIRRAWSATKGYLRRGTGTNPPQ